MPAVQDPAAIAATRYGTKVAVVDGPRTLTFDELDDRIGAAAALLRDAGVRAGDRIAVLTGNCLEWFDATLGAIRLGAVRSYLNDRLSPREIQTIIDDLEPKALFVAEHLSGFLHRLDASRVAAVLVTGPEYEEALSRARPVPPRSDASGTDIEFIRYTSGTTGAPKGVLHTAAARVAWTAALLAETGMRTGETVLHVSSLNFAAWGMAYPALHVGARQVVARRFDADEVLDVLASSRVAHTVMVPTMINDLLDAADAQAVPPAFPDLRTILYGSSPFTPAQLERCLWRFGPVLYGSYGMSEFNAATVLRPAEHAGDRLASVGRPHLLSEIRVVGGDGQPVAAGDVGTIQIRGAQAAAGYWRRPALDARLKASDGWLTTDDVGRLDPQGYLYVVDRRSDLIITGGFNVYPREIEVVLLDHPAVAEAVVVSDLDQRWGERVVGVVRAAPGVRLSTQDLDRWCRERLAGYKVPRAYRIATEPLPRNPNGKVLRRAIRDKIRTAGASVS